MKFEKTIEFIRRNKVRNDIGLVSDKLGIPVETVRKTIKKEPKSDLELEIFETFTRILLERKNRKQNLIKKAS